MGGRVGVPGAAARGVGRNPGEDCRNATRLPLLQKRLVPEQGQLIERVVERSNMQAAPEALSDAWEAWSAGRTGSPAGVHPTGARV